MPPVEQVIGRVGGALAALPIAAYAYVNFTGARVDPASPVANDGYGLWTVAIVVWIWMLYRPGSRITA